MLYLADYWDAEDFKATIERDLATNLSPSVYESGAYLTIYHRYIQLMFFHSARVRGTVPRRCSGSDLQAVGGAESGGVEACGFWLNGQTIKIPC